MQEENVFNVMSEIMQQQLGIYKAETEVKEHINNIINEEVSKYIYLLTKGRWKIKMQIHEDNFVEDRREISISYYKAAFFFLFFHFE